MKQYSTNRVVLSVYSYYMVASFLYACLDNSQKIDKIPAIDGRDLSNGRVCSMKKIIFWEANNSKVTLITYLNTQF